jgi:hypothetical protein
MLQRDEHETVLSEKIVHPVKRGNVIYISEKMISK